jgi:hypothetical protein
MFRNGEIPPFIIYLICVGILNQMLGLFLGGVSQVRDLKDDNECRYLLVILLA